MDGASHRLMRNGFWVGVLLVVVVVLTAPRAHAVAPAIDAVHVCRANQAVTSVLPGDLLVPAGVTCVLRGAAVRGHTEVRGQLYATSATFKKTVSIERGGTMYTSQVTMWGWVELHQARLFTTGDTTIVGSVVGSVLRPSASETARISFSRTRIAGDVDIVGGGFAGHSLDSYQARIEGSLRWKGESFSSFAGRVYGDVDVVPGRYARLCSTHVFGDVAVHGLRATGTPGDTLALGSPGGQCGGHTWIDGDVDLTDNRAAGRSGIDDVTIGGDLTCAANTPAPVVMAVEVRGARLGQCA